jgi:hypothetical protein
MPIEIRELQISVTVDNPQQGATNNNAQDDTQEGANRNKALIEHCIEQTLAIINNKKER